MYFLKSRLAKRMHTHTMRSNLGSGSDAAGWTAARGRREAGLAVEGWRKVVEGVRVGGGGGGGGGRRLAGSGWHKEPPMMGRARVGGGEEPQGRGLAVGVGGEEPQGRGLAEGVGGGGDGRSATTSERRRKELPEGTWGSVGKKPKEKKPTKKRGAGGCVGWHGGALAASIWYSYSIPRI
jgi:hypothetical protein